MHVSAVEQEIALSVKQRPQGRACIHFPVQQHVVVVKLVHGQVKDLGEVQVSGRAKAKTEAATAQLQRQSQNGGNRLHNSNASTLELAANLIRPLIAALLRDVSVRIGVALCPALCPRGGRGARRVYQGTRHGHRRAGWPLPA